MQCGRVGGRLFSTREPRFCQEPGLPFSLLPQASPPWGRRRGRAKPAPCNLRSPAPRIPAPGEPDGCQRPGGTRPGPRTKRHDFLGHGGVSNLRDMISLDMEAYQTFVFGSKSCGGQQWPETKGLRTPKCPIRLFYESYKTVLRVL